MTKDPAGKLKGEDLALAYDAVRVANRSVFSLKQVYRLASFHLCAMTYIWWMHLSLCLCQVSGKPAARPAQSAGGRAGGSEVAAQSSDLCFFLSKTKGISKDSQY